MIGLTKSINSDLMFLKYLNCQNLKHKKFKERLHDLMLLMQDF